MPKCQTCGQDLPEPEKPKVRKFEGTDEEWIKLAAVVAFQNCPTIYHCQHCDYPVVDGWCCSYCDSEDPGGAAEDNDSTAYIFSL